MVKRCIWVLRRYFHEPTLLSFSLYCCTNSPNTSCVYPFELCHSGLSRRYSTFLLALFRMKLVMDRVVSCTAVLASYWIRDIWRTCNKVLYIFSVLWYKQSQHGWIATYVETLRKEGLVTDRGKRYHHNHGEQARERDDLRSLEDRGNLWLGLIDLTDEFK